MKKEKYIAPAITSKRIVPTGILLEGSIQAGGSDITDVDTDQDPFAVKKQSNFDDDTFVETNWND